VALDFDLRTRRIDHKAREWTAAVTEFTSMRLLVVLVGDEFVTCSSHAEDGLFRLRLSKTVMAPVVGSELDARVEIDRNDAEQIVDGEILAFEVVEDCSPEETIAAWRDWWRSGPGKFWDGVEDIEKELGRKP
jgi:hypothetical protein